MSSSPSKSSASLPLVAPRNDAASPSLQAKQSNLSKTYDRVSSIRWRLLGGVVR